MSDARDAFTELLETSLEAEIEGWHKRFVYEGQAERLLAAPGVVIAALVETGALRRITTHAWDPTGCGIHKCNGNRRCHTLLRVVGGDGNDE